MPKSCGKNVQIMRKLVSKTCVHSSPALPRFVAQKIITWKNTRLIHSSDHKFYSSFSPAVLRFFNLEKAILSTDSTAPIICITNLKLLKG